MLRVGVFGVGHLGKFHLNNWKEIKSVEVVGFYDPSDGTAKEVEKKYRLRRFSEAAALMDAVDAVDVVAPTNYHYELCELAVRKGKHVFVEKPMADTLQEGKHLVQMVQEAGIKFQVGHVE